jgi:tetratricopeptide (TPR) repeat protein
MLENHNKRDKKHLFNLIKMRNQNIPNFALLMGAGASASSGIKVAGKMIDEWRQQLYEQSKSRIQQNNWLKKQDWYEDEEEYSILFEKVCDQRSQRRTHIEECVKDAKPSWGYIYLANIIAHNYFNCIFTPNFDDILNDACFYYADLRPIVCAHDSAVSDIRVTSARPKIIKLHGDFLYDSIKNTVRETEYLEKNMRKKFMQFAREYGLVVIGYGGNDRSIMDTFETILRSEGYLPNALYWCRRKEGKVTKKLQRLMKHENAYWIEIESYDTFMAELHEFLGLTLPDAVRDPYKATTERLNGFLLASGNIKHNIIKKDIVELEGHVKLFEKTIENVPESDKLLPHRFLGNREYRRHNYKDALLYFEKALIQKPDDFIAFSSMIKTLLWVDEIEKAIDMSKKFIAQAPDRYEGYMLIGDSLIFLGKVDEGIKNYNKGFKRTDNKTMERIDLLVSRSNAYLIVGQWKKALIDAEKAMELYPSDYPGHANKINRAIALKNLNKKKEANELLKEVIQISENKYFRACALAVRGQKSKMLKELKAAIKEDSKHRIQAKHDPDYTDYKDDLDFQKIVNKHK